MWLTWVWNQHELLSRTSLVIQWLGLCASRAGGMGSIPGQRTRIRVRFRVRARCMAQPEKKKREREKNNEWLLDHTLLLVTLCSTNGTHPRLYLMLCMYVSVTQLAPTLCDTMDCMWPDTSLCGIFQAKKYQSGLPFSSLKGSFWPRDQTRISWVSRIVGRIFTCCAIRKAHLLLKCK